ncbi:MAG: site-2 protease family protein [Solirubrobacterales bacterium]
MFGGGKSFTLFRIWGIRISVDWSWFIVLFLVIFWLSESYGNVLNQPSSATEPFLLAIVSAIGFFGSILLHELGHAWVALRNGIGITRISLWIFGGVAQMDRESDSPGTEFKVAAGGPAVTAAIAAVLIVVGTLTVGWPTFREALTLGNATEASGIIAAVAWLAAINVLLLGFNLLPAFPMDGGRIVRAIAWKITGKQSAATKFAAGLGRIFGYLFIGLGLFWMYTGDVFSGIWMALIGVLINSSARSASRQTAVSSRLEGVTVGDVMDEHPVSLPGSTTVDRALDEYFLRYNWSWFPVVDGSEQFSGIALRDRLDEIEETERQVATVGDYLEESSGNFYISQEAPLESLLGNPDLRKFGALMVTDKLGRLAGVVTVEQLGRALRPEQP